MLAALARLATRAASAAVALAVAAGLPYLLVTEVGWPLPTSWPDSLDDLLPQVLDWLNTPVTDQMAINALAVAAWLIWASLTTSLATEITARARGLTPRRIALLTPAQAAAGWLVTGITAGILAAAAPTHTATPATGPPPTITVQTTTSPDQPATTDHTVRAQNPDAAAHAQAEVSHHEVAKGDWMWHIAGRYLGDEARYPEIAALNPQLAQRYGQAYPDHIQPGDQLRLPDYAVDSGPRRHATGDPTTVEPPPAPAEPPAEPPAAAPPHTPPGATGDPPPDPTATATPPAPPPPAAVPPPATAPPPTAVPPSPEPAESDEFVEPDSPLPTPAGQGATPQPTGLDNQTTGPGDEHDDGSESPDQDHDDDGGDEASATGAGDTDGVPLAGGWVSTTLAAALATAAAIVWLRRRRRWRPPPAGAPPPAQTEPALPANVATLRRAVSQHAPHLLEPHDPGPTVRQARQTEQPPPPPARPSGPQLAGLGDLPANGLGLAGPGAAAAARALLVATLSTGGPHDPDARGQAIITAATLANLVDGPATVDLVGSMPRLAVAADLGHALTLLEQHILTRSRILADADAPDVATLHQHDPYHEPLPPILLIADTPTPPDAARLPAAIQLGQPLHICAVLLGHWPSGRSVHVHHDGTIDHHTATDHADDTPQRLAVLDTATTVEMLTMLAEAHTGQPPATPPEHQHPAPDTPPPETPSTTEAGGTGHTDHQPGLTAETPRPTSDTHPAPAAEAAATATARVRVQVLGNPAIYDHTGTPVTGLRRSAIALLVYLAVHREGANIPDILESIWPDATLRRARERLATTVANLRSALRRAADLADNNNGFAPVVNTGGRYHLDPTCVDIDWWRLLDNTTTATRTNDPHTRRAALEQAASDWTGLLHDQNYDWIEPHQHTCRRTGITIHTQLAELVADTQLQRAADLLDTACTIDPLNEHTAQAAITAHARLGNHTAIRNRLATLQQALADIDEDISDNTAQLVSDLLQGGQGRPVA